MKLFELTDDEFDTLHQAFDDVGCDCPGVDSDKLQALAEKLGIWQPIPPLTEEELKRQEEFANSQFAKTMTELFLRNNYVIERLMKENSSFAKDKMPVGSVLRIRLPKDYKIK